MGAEFYFSGYFGNDKFGLEDAFGINYGNVTATTRWNRIINDKLFSNTSILYNNFNYQVNIGIDNFNLKVNSILNDYSIKQDYDYYLNPKNRIKFGGISTWHNNVPGDITSSDTIISKNGLSRSNGWENALFIQNEQQVANNLYTYDNNRNAVDTLRLKPYQLARSYFNPEPRISQNSCLLEAFLL